MSEVYPLPAAEGGITELTGDVVAGPGSGSVVAELSDTGVTPGSYTNTDLTVDVDGRITAAANGTVGSSLPPGGTTDQVLAKIDATDYNVYWMTVAAGGASVTTSDTAPVSPSDGDLWVRTTDMTLNVYYDDGTSSQWVCLSWGSSGGVSHIVNGRLTLESGVPVSTTDQTSKTNVYFTPFGGNQITLWDGTFWGQYVFTEKTLALGTLTSGKPYDVFGYLSAGALVLEALAWTSDTARAIAVTLQDGRYCKSGDKTRLWLGTFYTTATTTTEDSAAKRYLFNCYNRAERLMKNAPETTDSWNYTTSTHRQANANAANQLAYVTGDPATIVEANTHAIVKNTSNNSQVCSGIGVDSTSVNSALTYGTNTGTVLLASTSRYRGTPGIGKHTLVWLEWSEAVGTATWYGDAGLTAGVFQSGITGIIWN